MYHTRAFIDIARGYSMAARCPALATPLADNRRGKAAVWAFVPEGGEGQLLHHFRRIASRRYPSGVQTENIGV